MKKIPLIFLLIVTFMSLCKAQSADEIINKYLDKTGGAKNWRALQTISMEMSMSSQGMNFNGTIYSKRPNKQKSVIDVMGKQVVEAFDGQDVWMINPYMGDTAATLVPDDMAQAIKDNDFESEFLDYSKKGHQAELINTDTTVNGKDTWVIKLTRKNGNLEYHYFDKETYLPIMIKIFVPSGPQKGMETDVYFGDFRPVGDLVFPFHMESKANGQTVQEVNFSNIKLDVPMEDSIFTFPGKK